MNRIWQPWSGDCIIKTDDAKFEIRKIPLSSKQKEELTSNANIIPVEISFPGSSSGSSVESNIYVVLEMKQPAIILGISNIKLS